MTDTIIALIALSLLGGFLGLIAWKVPQVPLLIVFSGVFAMVVFDFWLELRQRRQRRER